jgi:hypothetical protein
MDDMRIDKAEEHHLTSTCPTPNNIGIYREIANSAATNVVRT